MIISLSEKFLLRVIRWHVFSRPQSFLRPGLCGGGPEGGVGGQAEMQ
jgi:hypothetical protein